jgi:hypothetical protein
MGRAVGGDRHEAPELLRVNEALDLGVRDVGVDVVEDHAAAPDRAFRTISQK